MSNVSLRTFTLPSTLMRFGTKIHARVWQSLDLSPIPRTRVHSNTVHMRLRLNCSKICTVLFSWSTMCLDNDCSNPHLRLTAGSDASDHSYSCRHRRRYDGSGIAQVCAQAGWNTRLFDAFPEGLDAGMNRIDAFWNKGIERGKTTVEQNKFGNKIWHLTASWPMR